MHIITRDRIVYSFSRDHRPVQEVNIIKIFQSKTPSFKAGIQIGSLC